MKKVFLLSVITVIGLFTAVIFIQSRENNGDEILNANVEALAGPGVIVPCRLSPGDSCSYTVWAEDAEGKLVEVGVQTYENMRSTENEAN